MSNRRRLIKMPTEEGGGFVPTNKLYYLSSTEEIVILKGYYCSTVGAMHKERTLISNEYNNGYGVMTFDGVVNEVQLFNYNSSILTSVSFSLDNLQEGRFYLDDGCAVYERVVTSNFPRMTKYVFKGNAWYDIYAYGIWNNINPIVILGEDFTIYNFTHKYYIQNLWTYKENKVVFKSKTPYPITSGQSSSLPDICIVPVNALAKYLAADEWSLQQSKIHAFFESKTIPTNEGAAEYCLVADNYLYHYENGTWVLIG